MIATICSSVKRAFRIAPSESGASLSRNQWFKIPGAGQACLAMSCSRMINCANVPRGVLQETVCRGSLANSSHTYTLC
jgi:hypothetical protein